MSEHSTVNLIAGILSVTAFGFFAGAIWCLLKTRIFLRQARKTEGVVIANSTARNSDGGTTYVPLISFVTASGAEIQFAGNIGSNPPSYKIGERVKICYLPKRPREAKIFSFFNLHWLPLMFLIFSAATALAAIIVFTGGIE